MFRIIRNILKLSVLIAMLSVVACSKWAVGPHVHHHLVGDKFNRFGENSFVEASVNNTSTFLLDASGASYSYMRGSINRKHFPLRFSVRIEEYLNYFTFDYPDPEGDEPVAVSGEIGACPWAPEHRLMKLGVKGRCIQPEHLPASNYVFMVDVSGSMNSEGKLPLLKSALKMLVDNLAPDDRISIVKYSGTVQLALPSTRVAEASTIKEAISDLRAEGIMVDGNAVRMAYEEALANYIDGGNNRVVIATDGDFNFGLSSTDELLDFVEDYAEKGVYLSLCGLETGDTDASMMETIANKGNGNYIYMDCESEFLKAFAFERADYFKVVTASKASVKFDPMYVSSWRLIGYDNGSLSPGDAPTYNKFAGSIGSGQTVTALYELVPTENYESRIPVASFEFSCSHKGQQRFFTTMVGEPTSMGRMLPELDFAAGVAAYGMVLMNSKYKGTATLEMAEKLIASGLIYDEYGYRAELLSLVGKARAIRR